MIFQYNWSYICSVQFNHSVMSHSLQSHGLKHARLLCPSLSPGACSNLCPLSQWCHPSISSSVIPFSSCLQSFPGSGSFLPPQIYKLYHFKGRKLRGTKETFDENERREWKSWLKIQHSKTKAMASASINSSQNIRGESISSDRFYFLGLEHHCRWWPVPGN